MFSSLFLAMCVAGSACSGTACTSKLVPLVALIAVSCNVLQGLLAVAQLVRASTYRWWSGSKPRLLEISSDRAGCPLDQWYVFL